MSRIMAILAPLAVVQMALPAPAQGRTVMVAACGGAGGNRIDSLWHCVARLWSDRLFRKGIGCSNSAARRN